MNEWQPIETAPKDGTAILAFWTPPPNGTVQPNRYGVVRYELGEWFDAEDEDYAYAEPTHWMELPPAPPTD